MPSPCVWRDVLEVLACWGLRWRWQLALCVYVLGSAIVATGLLAWTFVVVALKLNL